MGGIVGIREFYNLSDRGEDGSRFERVRHSYILLLPFYRISK
ncbi:hypothetical protein LEP1GSC168_0798 [Leptospira santarosai str. HAI134]|nr:hypothetical protein LEP1GSC168_0798 [Leptospira santarosai str. HAI134]